MSLGFRVVGNKPVGRSWRAYPRNPGSKKKPEGQCRDPDPGDPDGRSVVMLTDKTSFEAPVMPKLPPPPPIPMLKVEESEEDRRLTSEKQKNMITLNNNYTLLHLCT